MTSTSARVRHLIGIGVHEDADRHITAIIERDQPALQRWQVDPKITALVAALHTKAWFSIDNIEGVISTSRGGRQGCKLGSDIFNAAYEQALSDMRVAMRENGIILRVRVNGSEPLWTTGADDTSLSDDHDWQDIIDVTYVDDEAALITAKSPRALNRAIHIMLEIYAATFNKYGLSINWRPGKIEGVLVYRGKHSAECLDALRHEGKKHLLFLAAVTTGSTS